MEENIEQRMANERDIVAATIRILREHRWERGYINDGGDAYEHPKDDEDALDIVFAVDEAVIYFHKNLERVGKTHWVHFILGNGIDVISDHSIPSEKSLVYAVDDFDKVMDLVNDYVEGLQA